MAVEDPSCGLLGLRAWDTLTLYRDVTNCVGQAGVPAGFWEAGLEGQAGMLPPIPTNPRVGMQILVTMQ